MAGYATPSWANNSAPAIDATAMTDIGQGIEIAEHPYGVCTTASNTAAKTVTVDYSGTLTLFTGMEVRVKFDNATTASSPTLNVNSTGAKAIMLYGTTRAGANAWIAGDGVSFRYDGTNWIMSAPSGGVLTNIATVENSTTASHAYTVGEYLCLNGILYRVTVDIASGGTITPGTNCTSTTIGADLHTPISYSNLVSGSMTVTSFSAFLVGKVLFFEIRFTVTADIASNTEIIRLLNAPPYSGQTLLTMYKGFTPYVCRVNAGLGHGRLYPTNVALNTNDNINISGSYIVE